MKYLKKTFRWFGPAFGVNLGEIRQLGVDGIVTACHNIPTGEIWPADHIATIKEKIEAHGMEWSVVESVNVHNAIKYGLPERDTYIQNYIETLRNLASKEIYTVCYNFMPLIDWTRTDLHYELPNGAISLLFDPDAIAAFDLFVLKRERASTIYSEKTKARAEAYFNHLDEEGKKALEQSILAGIPGSKELIAKDLFKKNLEYVAKIKKDELQKNLVYFLSAVIPAAEKLGIKMALHPDDPPFPVFGIPRIASTYADLQFVIDCCPSKSNGITFCSGSLGATASNDLVKIIRDFGHKIHFIHLRNVIRNNDGRFYEAPHLKGSIPMEKIMMELVKEQKKRFQKNQETDIPLRPDHGHVVLNDKQKEHDFYPGYSLIGRALGMAELWGLEKGVREAL